MGGTGCDYSLVALVPQLLTDVLERRPLAPCGFGQRETNRVETLGISEISDPRRSDLPAPQVPRHLAVWRNRDGPKNEKTPPERGDSKWAIQDSNLGPLPYQAGPGCSPESAEGQMSLFDGDLAD
jgi:hypothetical protein